MVPSPATLESLARQSPSPARQILRCKDHVNVPVKHLAFGLDCQPSVLVRTLSSCIESFKDVSILLVTIKDDGKKKKKKREQLFNVFASQQHSLID